MLEKLLTDCCVLPFKAGWFGKL